MSASRKARRAISYGLGITAAVPRTLGFAATTLMQTGVQGGGIGRVTNLSPSLLAQVAMDEVVLAAMKTPSRFPRRADYEMASSELLDTYEMFLLNGWAEDPRSYHEDPSAPDAVMIEPAFVMGRGWEHVWFESGFEPKAPAEATDRWNSREANSVMRAWVRRKQGSDAWVICVHPFGTGQSKLGHFMFKADELANRLGANVALVVLPMHASRGGGWIAGGSAFMTYNPVDVLLGLTQSVWDVRRFIAWLRASGAGPVTLYGLSLGAHVSATVAGFEEDLAGVVAGVPTCDLLEVFSRHVPRRLHPRAREHHLIGDEARAVLKVTSPLTFEPRTRGDRLYIFASTGDRMSPPEQAQALWGHWRSSEIAWFDANHVAFIWNGGISDFVIRSLSTALDLPAAA